MSNSFPALLADWGIEAAVLPPAAIAAFMGILFLQSGLDKVLDYGGNKAWLTGHFAESPLKGTVPLLLPALTLVECAAGLFSAIGCVQLIISGTSALAYWGLLLSVLSLLMLFFGQRLAKDYPGAATLVPYFIAAIAGLFLLS
jgi:hypothetical protein